MFINIIYGIILLLFNTTEIKIYVVSEINISGEYLRLKKEILEVTLNSYSTTNNFKF
jgi:hypothetical protein